MSDTKIEWTEKTWNPVTGCTKVSAGCLNCYAEKMAKRLQAMGNPKYKLGFWGKLHGETLTEPLKWKKPCKIFVCSMSDLFHEGVPDYFRDWVFETIEKTPQHIYQILTKRAIIMYDYFTTRRVPRNVWLGVTVEDNSIFAKTRIFNLLDIFTFYPIIRFISFEPLLQDVGELFFEYNMINWVIVGGESGNQARPMKKEWVINILEQCREKGIPFFFKQWGTYGEDGIKRSKKANGAFLNGEIIQEYPKYAYCNT